LENKTKILIVDDETINLDFFDVMLTKLGFKVELAEDGEEALDKVRAFSPDMIILDNIMPKMTGWEVTRLLKKSEDYKDFRNIPVIMFSAMDDVQDKIEGFELGIEDYITKPFNFSEVLARIRSVLQRKVLEKNIMAKEKKMALVTSLNRSLVYFTKHLKKPVLDLLKASQAPGANNKKSVTDFAKHVGTECEKILVALKTLEEEIQELSTGIDKDDGEGNEGLLLEDLETKFQEQFKIWREETSKASGVKS